MVLTTLFAALTLGQEPTNVTIAAPEAVYYAAQSADKSLSKRVSLNFSEASLKDVLNFLRKQKIDFAVDPDQFKDRRISLSLTDVPVSRAMSAIASALNAHWESVGGVSVLKQGASSFGFTTAPGFESFVYPRDFQGMKGFDKKSIEEAQKAMEKARKELQGKTFEFRSLDKAQSEEIRKALENAQKGLRDRRFELRTLPDGKIRKTIILGNRDIDGLLKSITPAQKELQKKQGYLKVSDLTDEQRKLAGLTGEGTIEIVITRDGETLKIKNG